MITKIHHFWRAAISWKTINKKRQLEIDRSLLKYRPFTTAIVNATVPRRCPRFPPFVRTPIVPALHECGTIDDKRRAYRGLQTSPRSRDTSNVYDCILGKQLYLPYQQQFKNTHYIRIRIRVKIKSRVFEIQEINIKNIIKVGLKRKRKFSTRYPEFCHCLR